MPDFNEPTTATNRRKRGIVQYVSTFHIVVIGGWAVYLLATAG
ncbi:MAG: hypothetical protein AAGH68_04900 [Pseudomonadota bacterium]